MMRWLPSELCELLVFEKVGTDMQMCRAYIESIAAIDKNLHTEVVADIVVSALEKLQSSGPSAVPWQQAELAMHLVYTFGELNKSESSEELADVRQYSSCLL